MKKTSKLLLLLAAFGMLIGCKGKTSGNTPSGGDDKPSGGDDTPAEVTENLLNVIYFNSYVSENRANQIKSGLIEALTAGGEQVDASKINFFQSRNSKVAGLGEEILDYNEENPKNTIDVLLGANNFNAWDDEELKPIFEAKYVNDGVDYTYGTHSNLSNNNNRKFFYDKDKAEDKYVKALQAYLQEHYTGETPVTPVEPTSTLTVAVYGTFVSFDRMEEIKTGFEAYLTTNNVTIENLTFVRDADSTTIADFMTFVEQYDKDNPNEKVDALLGLKTNSAITAAGFSNDGTEYTYSDSEGHEADRRFWYHAESENLANIKHLEAYLKANWVPVPVVENTYFLIGAYNEWSTENLTRQLTLVEEGKYSIANVEFEANEAFKVYCPEEQAYYTNASTWADCGFTLGDNNNIVVTEAGQYTVNFFVTGENDNHVVLEKQAAPKTLFVVGIYDKFVDDDQAAQIKTGIETYYAAHDVNADVVTTKLGTGNMKSMAGAVTAYNTANTQPIDVVLGAKITHEDLTAAGYELGETVYTYGNDSTANDRKLLVLSASKTRAEYLAFVEYMDANWLYVPEPDYYLIGSFNEWNVEDLTYKLTKVEAESYKYENLTLKAGETLKVFTPGETATYYTNASTWTDCGFTLGENNNIVVSVGGIYTVNFFVVGENDNHVTLEKTAELPTASYYLVGSFNSWNQEDTTYALELSSEGVYTYEDMQFEAGAEFKVLKVEGSTKTLFTSAHTWEGCGFTLGENNNIVVTEAGKYTVNYYVNGENDNYVTITKAAAVTFTVGFYLRYVGTEKVAQMTAEIQKYFADNNVAVDTLVFESFGETSKTNIATVAGLITTYNTEHEGAPVNVILGANGDSNDAFKNAGYQKYSETSYTYGTEANRKLWCQIGHTEDVGVQAVLAYLTATYPVA